MSLGHTVENTPKPPYNSGTSLNNRVFIVKMYLKLVTIRHKRSQYLLFLSKKKLLQRNSDHSLLFVYL